eukprot:9878284-Alexandrium_andersonii.AAC.1
MTASPWPTHTSARRQRAFRRFRMGGPPPGSARAPSQGLGCHRLDLPGSVRVAPAEHCCRVRLHLGRGV